MIFIKNNHNTLIFIINFYWIYHEICYYPVNHYSDEFMQGSLKSCIYNYLTSYHVQDLFCQNVEEKENSLLWNQRWIYVVFNPMTWSRIQVYVSSIILNKLFILANRWRGGREVSSQNNSIREGARGNTFIMSASRMGG